MKKFYLALLAGAVWSAFTSESLALNAQPVQTYPAVQSAAGAANVSGTIASTGVFQTLWGASAVRVGCIVQNNGGHTMWLAFGASPTQGGALQLAPGASVSCADGSGVASDAISITGTTGDAFFATQAPMGAPKAGANAASAAGLIGGYEFNVGTATTVQNAAYAAGQSLGGLQTVSVGATGGLSGILTGIQIGTGGGTAYGSLTVYVWSKNPAGTTCTDKTNFVASAADNAYLLNGTPVNVSLATVAAAQDTGLYGNVSNLVAPFVNGSANTDLYVCILATVSVTPASTTGPRFNLSGIKDQP